jgi:hypothetical protein
LAPLMPRFSAGVVRVLAGVAGEGEMKPTLESVAVWKPLQKQKCFRYFRWQRAPAKVRVFCFGGEVQLANLPKVAG